MFCSLLTASIFCQILTCQIYERSETKTATFTAYTLSEDETDSSPDIGAGNHNLKEYREKGIQVCASRSLPLHTKINIKGFGNCEILDRTALKYANRIDILFPTKKEALKFGKQTLEYLIIK